MAKTYTNGRDVALVAVISRPLGATEDVKTIVLAGLSGTATEAAARAVCRDFRDLEPESPHGFVLGVLEAIYNKYIPHRDERRLVRYNWKYLRGGRRNLGSVGVSYDAD